MRLHCVVMAKTIEIPDELHERLAERARACGISVGEYLVHLLDIPVPKRTPPEVLERIRSRTAVDLGISAADLIRAGREERMQQLDEPWWSSTPQR